jgi:hypothetical protein
MPFADTSTATLNAIRANLAGHLTLALPAGVDAELTRREQETT